MATTLFNNLITFSRGTNATLVGANGLVQYAPNNLLTYSDQFDNAAWSKSNTTVTANATTAPDGTTTADKLAETATTAVHNTGQSITTTATAYTFSCYVKAAERNFALLYHTQTNASVAVNLSTGATGTASGTVAPTSSSVTSAGNGWWRVTMTVTATAASNFFGVYVMNDLVSSSYAGTAGSGIYTWGAQLELGTTATTYNSTTVKNLLGYSEAFDNAAWTKTRASIVTGAAANPLNGLFTAQKLMEDTTASNSHLVAQVFSAVSATTPYTFSVYAKAAGRNIMQMTHANSTPVAFDLAAGTAGSGGVISSLGNGWYRCSITATAPDTVTRAYSIFLTSSGTVSYTGDGNSGVYIYGAQLSDSGSLDPYVPTPGAAPTSAAYYGPRFDYDPVTLQPKGLLIEEARTNLTTYSEQFDNAAWSLTNATVTANAVVSPDGATTADKLVETSATGEHRVLNNGGLTVVSGTAHTWSVFVKSAERTVVQLRNNNLSGATFDLANNAAASGVTAGFTASSTAFGNGWFRIAITGNTASTTDRIVVNIVSGGTNSYAGTAGSGIYIWGAQLEAGAFATSYIPTVASTVTRSADVATITGSLFSGWYNGAQGTFVVGADSIVGNLAAVNVPASVSDGTASNYTRLYIYSAARGASSATGGVTQADLSFAGHTSGAVSKWGFGYAVNNYALSVNGATPGTDTAGTVPTVDRLGIGALNSLNQLNGHIRSITYLPVRNADYQIQGFTA